MPPVKAPFQPILTWQDERGYQLSDRIWSVSEGTASQIDLLLESGIAEGRSSTALANDLVQFLLPNRQYVRTNTPYGTDGSYFASRLARSEITLASSMSTKLAAMLNPFVTRMYYHLSASHMAEKGGDSCEDFADESDANDGFEPEDCPTPIADTHSNCMCYTTSGTLSSDDALALITDDLNAQEDAAVFTNDNQFALLELAIWGLAPAFLERILGD